MKFKLNTLIYIYYAAILVAQEGNSPPNEYGTIVSGFTPESFAILSKISFC